MALFSAPMPISVFSSSSSASRAMRLVETEAGEGAVEIDVVGADQRAHHRVGFGRLDARHRLLELVRRAERDVFLADHLAAVLRDVLLTCSLDLRGQT